MVLTGPVVGVVHDVKRASVSRFYRRVRLYHGFAADQEAVSGSQAYMQAPSCMGDLCGYFGTLPLFRQVPRPPDTSMSTLSTGPPEIPRHNHTRTIDGACSDASTRVLASVVDEYSKRRSTVETRLMALTTPYSTSLVLCSAFSSSPGQQPATTCAAGGIGVAVRQAQCDTYAIACTPRGNEESSTVFFEWRPNWVGMPAWTYLLQLRSSRDGLPRDMFTPLAFGEMPGTAVVFSHATAHPPILYHRRLDDPDCFKMPAMLTGSDVWDLVVDFVVHAWGHMLWTPATPELDPLEPGMAALCVMVPLHAAWNGHLSIEVLFDPIFGPPLEEGGEDEFLPFFVTSAVDVGPERRAVVCHCEKPRRIVGQLSRTDDEAAGGARG